MSNELLKLLNAGGGSGLHGDSVKLLSKFLEDLATKVAALEAATASIPTGGEVGQFIAKKSLTDFDMEWQTAPYADYTFNSSQPKTANQFNDWEDLYATLLTIEGPKTVTFEQDETMPAGNYDFSNIVFRGNFRPIGGGALVITLDEGVVFTSITQARLEGGIVWVNSGSAPNMVIGAGEFPIFPLTSNAGIASTNAPVFAVEDGGNIVIAVVDGSRVADLGQPVLDLRVDAGFGAVAFAGTAGTVDDNTVMGDGAVFARLIQSVSANTSSGASHAAFSGVVFDQIFTNAALLGYDPSGTSGVLTATNVSAALNEIAGLL
jgi:hypothetical protein